MSYFAFSWVDCIFLCITNIYEQKGSKLAGLWKASVTGVKGFNLPFCVGIPHFWRSTFDSGVPRVSAGLLGFAGRNRTTLVLRKCGKMNHVIRNMYLAMVEQWIWAPMALHSCRICSPLTLRGFKVALLYSIISYFIYCMSIFSYVLIFHHSLALSPIASSMLHISYLLAYIASS